MHTNIEEDEIDIKEIFKTLGKYKKSIIFFVLLFTLLAATYAYITPNIYTTATTIEIGETKSNASSSEDMLAMAINPGMTNTDTEIEIIKSRYLIEKALKKVDFTHRYYAKKNYKETEIYDKSPFEVVLEKGKGVSFTVYPMNTQYYRLEAKYKDEKSLEEWEIEKVYAYGKSVDEKHFDFTLYLKEGMALNKKAVYRFVILNKIDAVKEIQKSLSVVQTTKGSTILELSFSDNVALRAQQLTDALAKAYLTQEIDRKTEEASMILAFIDKQLSGINSSLKDSEENLEKFKKKSSMLNLGSKAEGVVSKMSEYEGKLAETNIEEQMLNSLYNQIQQGKNFESISAAGLDISSTGIPKLIQNLQETVLKRTILLADYTTAHPEVKKLTQSMNQIKKVITSTIKTLKVRVSRRKALLKKTIKEYDTLMDALPEKEKIFGGLQRKFIVNEKIYSYLLEKRATTAISKASTVNKSRILDKALLPIKPIKPKRALIMLVGMILGLIFGIGEEFEDTKGVI